MNVIRWMRDRLSSRPDASAEKYERAVAMTKEVHDIVRERINKQDPFTAISLDLLRQALSVEGVDMALVADSYEMHQEAKLFYGKDRRKPKV